MTNLPTKKDIKIKLRFYLFKLEFYYDCLKWRIYREKWLFILNYLLFKIRLYKFLSSKLKLKYFENGLINYIETYNFIREGLFRL